MRRFCRAFRLMLLARRLDDREILLKRQNRIFFQISGAGHEAIQVAAGLVLQPGPRLGLSLLPRPRPVPDAGRDADEMLLQAVGAADDPASGGRQMPSHWGSPSAEHRQLVLPHRHAISAGRRMRRGRPATEPGVRMRSRWHLRRRRHQRGRVLGGDQRGLPGAPARAVPDRRQRLRHLRARRASDGRAAASRSCSRDSPACCAQEWTAATSLASHKRDDRAAAYCREAPRAGAGPRARDPPLLPLALRRRAPLQDPRRSGGRSRARPGHCLSRNG